MAQTLQLREARGQTNTYLRPVMIAAAKLLAPVLGRFQWAQRAWLVSNTTYVSGRRMFDFESNQSGPGGSRYLAQGSVSPPRASGQRMIYTSP
jgi:hypothetical protein